MCREHAIWHGGRCGRLISVLDSIWAVVDNSVLHTLRAGEDGRNEIPAHGHSSHALDEEQEACGTGGFGGVGVQRGGRVVGMAYSW